MLCGLKEAINTGIGRGRPMKSSQRKWQLSYIMIVEKRKRKRKGCGNWRPFWEKFLLSTWDLYSIYLLAPP